MYPFDSIYLFRLLTVLFLSSPALSIPPPQCNTCSPPVFWEQQGIQTFGQRIQITRPQASQPAFDRHFASLVEEYGASHAINLLGTKENEALLTAAYARHMSITRHSVGDTIGITNFDFHTAVKYGGHESVFRDVQYVFVKRCDTDHSRVRTHLCAHLRRLESVIDNVDRFGFAMADAGSSEIITEQKGIFRANCLDWYVLLRLYAFHP